MQADTAAAQQSHTHIRLAQTKLPALIITAN